MRIRRLVPHGKVGRFAAVAAGLLLVIGALFAVKFAQISRLIAFGEQAEAAGPPPEAVASAIATAQRWEVTIPAVGTIASYRSVEIRSEVSGIVRRIHFDSGDLVKKGDELIELDASTERSELASARARRDLARANAARARQLVQQNALARADLDSAEAELRATAGQVAAIEAQIAKKVMRAPFAGRLGIRAVNLGQFVDPGTVVTVLDALGEAFVDFPVPQEELPRIEVGMPVLVALEEGEQSPLDGTIVAVAPTVDEVTRNAELRAHVPDEEERLRAGMFASVSVVLPLTRDVVAVPATAIVHASYGDSVFVIEDRKPDAPGMARTPDGRPVRIARQQFVRIGPARGDFVAIEAGLEPGVEVVVAGAFKLRNGAPVVIDNSKQPRPSLDPRPENR